MFAAIFDGMRLSVREVHRISYTPIAARTGLYWDFFRIFETMAHGLRQLQVEGDICSLGIDSFSNDFGFINSQGELLTPIRCYRDRRTQEYEAQMHAILSERKLYFGSGNQLAPFNTLMQLAAMQLSADGKIPSQAKSLLLVPDLLIYLATGAVRTEYTIASVTQMYSFRSQGWKRDFLHAFSIPEAILPPVQQPGIMCGMAEQEYCDSWNLRQFPVASVCEHDTASAFAACPCPEDGAIISCGTWSLVGVETQQPVYCEEGFRYNIANEGGPVGHHRLIRNVMGLWILQQLILEIPYKTYDQIAEAVENSSPFRFYIDVDHEAYFSPLHMREKIRTECLRRYGCAPETEGEYVRCILESLAMKYRWAVEKLERVSGKKIHEIWLIGGGSHNRQLCRMTADISGRRVLAALPEATAAGNAVMQLVASGELDNIEQGRALTAVSFQPDIYEPGNSCCGAAEYSRYLYLMHLEES